MRQVDLWRWSFEYMCTSWDTGSRTCPKKTPYQKETDGWNLCGITGSDIIVCHKTPCGHQLIERHNLEIVMLTTRKHQTSRPLTMIIECVCSSDTLSKKTRRQKETHDWKSSFNSRGQSANHRLTTSHENAMSPTRRWWELPIVDLDHWSACAHHGTHDCRRRLNSKGNKEWKLQRPGRRGIIRCRETQWFYWSGDKQIEHITWDCDVAHEKAKDVDLWCQSLKYSAHHGIQDCRRRLNFKGNKWKPRSDDMASRDAMILF